MLYPPGYSKRAPQTDEDPDLRELAQARVDARATGQPPRPPHISPAAAAFSNSVRPARRPPSMNFDRHDSALDQLSQSAPPAQAQGSNPRTSSPFGAASTRAQGNAFANVDRSGQQNLTGGGDFANRPRDPRQPRPTLGAGPRPPSTPRPGQIATNNLGLPSTPTTAAVDASGIRDVVADPSKAPGANDDLHGLASQQITDKEYYDSREADLKASKAQALQQAEARAGLGGMGLSGGTAALVGDVSRVQDRGINQDLYELAQAQQEARFKQQQQDAAIDEYEVTDDLDRNDDGMIAGHKIGEDGWGDGNPDNNKYPGDEKPKPTSPRYDDEVNFAGDRPNRHGLDEWAAYTDDFEETSDHGHNPLDEYVGSDEQFDYYIGRVDHKKWRVPRAKKGSPGIRA